MPWEEASPDVESRLEAPMPWIGMYVAAASLVCTLAMAADTFRGIWTKKYWFPSKYFSVNATSLTLLAVAMKLPVDLTTRMYAATDRLAKVSSLIFLSTSMANFLTSLGSMSDRDVLMNVVALGILVITVTANVCIQVIQLQSYLGGRLAFIEEILAVGSMLLLLVMFTSSGLMILSTKRYLEKKHKEMHKLALNEEQVDMRRVKTDELRVLVKKYWVMAETSSPQFVLARSVMCTTSGAVSLLIAVILVEVQIRMAMQYRIFHQAYSSYGWSTKWILLIQTGGVIIGTIAPAARWFTTISIRSSNKGSNSIKSSFMVESYWTQKMVDWNQRSLSMQIRHLKLRKVLHDLRWLILKFCISLQFLTVLTSKLVLLVSVFATSPLILCLKCVRRLKRQKQVSDSGSSRNQETSEINADDSEMDIGHYVLLLEGEVEPPPKTLENICKEVDDVIQRGKFKKIKNFLQILQKSCSFSGIAEFDSQHVPSLHSQDPPYCWSLPVVTLTCIALALPNVEKQKANSLLTSVTEGIYFVKLIDKTFGKKGGLSNVRTAATVVWMGVELYHKWQDKDLHETSSRGKNADEILKELCIKAERTVLEFKRGAKDSLMRNPLHWPAKVIAANSMYRICRTILMNYGAESDKTDEEVFEALSTTIADIMAACVTNLPQVITMKCHNNATEEREESVKHAAILLGQSEEIIDVLLRRELPLLAPEKAAYIEEWRAALSKLKRSFAKMPEDAARAADVEKHLEAPLPWIGMYIAAASLICTLAMAADTFTGLRKKKYWFPSKFFYLNATSLTLLAVAMKLPVDFSTRMYAPTDRLAKISSHVFMSTAMGNLITCLGSMDDKDILMNVTALSILVITIIVNVNLQIFQMRHYLGGRRMFVEEIIAFGSMYFLLLMIISSAVMVSATKRYLESKYHEMMKRASDEQMLESMEEGNFTFHKLRLTIQKYWVMAETSSPQFVIARSVTCTAAGVVCLLTSLVLMQAEIRMVIEYKKIDITASKYDWSIKWILLAQTIGVAVGTIAPAFRCFTGLKIKFHGNGKWSFKDEFTVEPYWTQRLVEWKDSSLPLQIRDKKWRKVLSVLHIQSSIASNG